MGTSVRAKATIVAEFELLPGQSMGLAEINLARGLVALRNAIEQGIRGGGRTGVRQGSTSTTMVGEFQITD